MKNDVFWCRHEPQKVLANPDVALMTAEEFGAYNLLLDYAWMSGDCTLTNDKEELARLARVAKVSERVLRQFETNKDGRLFNAELLAEWKNALKRSKDATKAIKARWDKSTSAEVAA